MCGGSAVGMRGKQGAARRAFAHMFSSLAQNSEDGAELACAHTNEARPSVESLFRGQCPMCGHGVAHVVCVRSVIGAYSAHTSSEIRNGVRLADCGRTRVNRAIADVTAPRVTLFIH